MIESLLERIGMVPQDPFLFADTIAGKEGSDTILGGPGADMLYGGTQQERGVSTLSDLAPIADELTFAAPPECPARYLCAIGLEEVYSIEFAEFIPLDERFFA